MARPSVRLIADSAVPVEADASRLGGLPDLPSSTSWPRDDDGPLSFIAQVNLADVAPYDSEGVLPRDGLLSFFYDAVTQDAWGFDPADVARLLVIYPPHTPLLNSVSGLKTCQTTGCFKRLVFDPSAS
jgi:uncharacterized protein YwqG